MASNKGQNFIGADQRVDVVWKAWGFAKAKYYKGTADGRDFEKTPYKTKRLFNWRRALQEFDRLFGFEVGAIQKGLHRGSVAGSFAVASFFAKIDIPTLAAPFVALAIASDTFVAQEADTISVTVGNNTNRMMVVCFGTYQGSDPSGMTYSGAALTERVDAIGSFGESSSIWEKVAPAVGTANMVVSGGSNYRASSVYSLYNCDQNLSTVTAEAGGDSNTASVAITPGSNNNWIIWSLESEPVPTMTTTSGVSDNVDEGASYQHQAASHFVQGTAASKTGSYSLSYGARWNICAVAIVPSASATTSSSSSSSTISTSSSSSTKSTSSSSSTVSTSSSSSTKSTSSSSSTVSTSSSSSTVSTSSSSSSSSTSTVSTSSSSSTVSTSSSSSTVSTSSSSSTISTSSSSSSSTVSTSSTSSSSSTSTVSTSTTTSSSSSSSSISTTVSTSTSTSSSSSSSSISTTVSSSTSSSSTSSTSATTSTSSSSSSSSTVSTSSTSSSSSTVSTSSTSSSSSSTLPFKPSVFTRKRHMDIFVIKE